MKKSKALYEYLFTKTGCLSLDTLLSYVHSRLEEEEKAIVNKHLGECELCNDALSGLKANQDERKIRMAVEQLNLQARVRTGASPAKASSPNFRRIAATIAVLILVAGGGSGALFLYRNFITKREAADAIPAVRVQKQNHQNQPSTPGALQNHSAVRLNEKMEDSSVYAKGPVTSFDNSSAPNKEERYSDRLGISEPGLQDETPAITKEELKNVTGQNTNPGMEKTADGLRASSKENNGIDEGADLSVSESNAGSNKQVFQSVEQMPEFPGGYTALSSYLRDNLRYPDEALEKKTEGAVVVAFVISERGKPEDIRILRELGSGCDEEALRLIRKMPRWKPGLQNGEPAKVQLNVQVKFKLE